MLDILNEHFGTARGEKVLFVGIEFDGGNCDPVVDVDGRHAAFSHF